MSIILQNLAQLKSLFKDEWEGIIGNCDSFLYLGGNDLESMKYLVELLGEETIDTNTYGKSTGGSGSYSTNYQNTGRKLLTPGEIRKLDNAYAVLLMRGQDPVFDLKYNVTDHPNVRYTRDFRMGIIEKLGRKMFKARKWKPYYDSSYVHGKSAQEVTATAAHIKSYEVPYGAQIIDLDDVVNDSLAKEPGRFRLLIEPEYYKQFNTN
jgi:type IV secretory pathway TraG/TraD family ATPase VirD4